MPIYHSSGNVFNEPDLYKNYSRFRNGSSYIPHDQPMLYSADNNFTSLFSGLLGLDVESTSCTSQSAFPYAQPSDNGEMICLGTASTTPVFKTPSNPRPHPKNQRQNSWPGDSIDDIMQVEPFKPHQSNQCYTSATLVMGQQPKPTRPRHHRRTPSESNITLHPYLSQSVSLPTDSSGLPVYQQQQHHLSRSPQRHNDARDPRSKSLPRRRKPYTHREPVVSSIKAQP